MKRPTTQDAARAAAFVLGALPPEAAADLSERIDASPALREEVESLRAVADELLLAAEPVPPRADVRDRLLSRVAADAAGTAAPRPPLPDLLFAFDADAVWKDVGPGLQRRLLSRGPDAVLYVVRVAPGATIPAHDHERVEHSYILSGSIDVDGTLCRPGDYHRAAAGTRHVVPYSAEGCVMLVVESAA
jgi:anti-sigma factor ChrR (cupin superfamily)